jgi:hypothetical protein
MKHSQRPLWKKSMLQTLNRDSILDFLDEISDNGDSYGYVRDQEYYVGEGGYYQEYKDQFDDLSDGAYYLADALRDYDIREHWDDMTVALLGVTHKVLGYDSTEYDYYEMLSYEEEWAESEAVKRIERLSKKEMIRCFRKVLTILISFYDIKAAHDCLTSIVTELDERAAMMQRGGDPPQRAWVE